jgi:hypothetical protein
VTPNGGGAESAKEHHMMQNRTFWVVASLLVGALQAWDSGALEAGAAAQALIGAGLLLPVVSIVATADQRVRVLALIAGAALLAWARMIAVVSLNTLHLALFVPTLYILFVGRLTRRVVPGVGR